MANIDDLIQRARTIRIETKSKRNTADRIGGLLLDIVNGLVEAQSLKKAQYGGIVATSADVVSDYAAKGYSGPYFYLVGSSLSSLVVYQYAGTGTPAQAFGGAAYDFTDFSEAISRQNQLELELDRVSKKEIVPLHLNNAVVGHGSTIDSVPSNDYRIVYYEATDQGQTLVKLRYTRNASNVTLGKIFIVNSANDIAIGTAVSVIYQVAQGETYVYTANLTQGQCLCIDANVVDDVKFYIPADSATVISESIETCNRNITVLQENVVTINGNITSINNAINYIEDNEATLNFASKLVANRYNSLQEVPSDYYKICYVKATKNCICSMTVTRNRDYTTDGKFFKLASESLIVDGTPYELIDQVELGQTKTITQALSIGECLCVSVMYSSDPSYNSDVIIVTVTESTPIKQVVKELKEKVDSDIPTEYNGRDICVFNRILCIGDSLTKGIFNHHDIEGETWPSTQRGERYSYPTILSKMTGVETVNLGVGSITSARWYQVFAEDTQLEDADCAIIQLGVNDDAETLDTVSATALTNIITLLKSKNTGIFIFLAGIINAKSYRCAGEEEPYYAKDQFIKSFYTTNYANDDHVYLIDHATYGHLRDLDSVPTITYPTDNYNQGHLSAYGYWRLAQDYISYISYIMHKDKSNVFRGIQFIGTPFYYN